MSEDTSPEQGKVAEAIQMAWKVYEEAEWRAWAEDWITGRDREDAAAEFAARAALERVDSTAVAAIHREVRAAVDRAEAVADATERSLERAASRDRPGAVRPAPPAEVVLDEAALGKLSKASLASLAAHVAAQAAAQLGSHNEYEALLLAQRSMTISRRCV